MNRTSRSDRPSRSRSRGRESQYRRSRSRSSEPDPDPAVWRCGICHHRCEGRGRNFIVTHVRADPDQGESGLRVAFCGNCLFFRYSLCDTLGDVACLLHAPEVPDINDYYDPDPVPPHRPRSRSSSPIRYGERFGRPWHFHPEYDGPDPGDVRAGYTSQQDMDRRIRAVRERINGAGR